MVSIVVSNALFAVILVVLYKKQKRLETDSEILDEDMYTWEYFQEIHTGHVGDIEAMVSNIDESQGVFAERLCSLETKMANIELNGM